ncbi:unnamed protein product [Ostreobium quekettii]|uniref:Uncharacterized protein n=1 Tax=Ostreobium quekettii TaxID=121088 RepID=A0A8S1IPX1_9CHLO|nr:unnamed protein product [Ostreobium quekettii]
MGGGLDTGSTDSGSGGTQSGDELLEGELKVPPGGKSGRVVARSSRCRDSEWPIAQKTLRVAVEGAAAGAGTRCRGGQAEPLIKRNAAERKRI